ncbi:GT-D fold domain-containing glycosyltransferase [Leuconostoc gelidum]|uniref:GT-D fold domain-containing glycosyltransferase n=1 Tax=Leuconostoc gelidum TaxID=1244 RepID=UPI001C7D81C8|nr:GT-D fold domain-containing glycosyltransferase [Leuconostoc gelidum]MBZ6010602.1 DUF1792 domain-containing protein [Leuconostoc gelidum subsp. aenigmaticum]
MQKIIKNKFSQLIIKSVRSLYYPLFFLFSRNSDFKVLSPSETVQNINKKKLSISRFGDGEFNIMFRKKGIGFQKYSDELRDELFKVKSSENNVIAIPHGFVNTKNDKFSVKTFWWAYVVRNNKFINNFVSSKRQVEFFDTNFSRVITELRDQSEIDEIINSVKKIWSNKNVIMVEGAATRFGVANDLFENASSVNRILAPNENSYHTIDTIEHDVHQLLSNLNIESDQIIVLIALGPTATVLAYRLKNYVQSVDIGHFDLQYEFYKRGFYHKVPVIDRYDNESLTGNNVEEVNNLEYKNQIYSNLS